MAPSGAQVEIRHGNQRAVLVELGGGLRAYEVGRAAVLDGYGAEELVSGGRGQVLVPWPNRLHTGRYSWDGEEHVVPLDEPEKSNALHGLVRWRSWQPTDVDAVGATMSLSLLPQPAYPFSLQLSVRYELGDEGLSVTTSATNVGPVPAPYGQGAHPYLTAGTARVDDAHLRVPARTWLPTDGNGVPTGREPVHGSPYDFTSPRPIGDLALDHAFTDLHRGADGRAEVALSSAERTVTLWADEGYPYVQVFTGDELPEPARRRRGLAVEPMTCPPDAFRSGQDVLRLEPCSTVTRRWGIRVDRPHA